jgi:anaerobic selenocysteine-containing dehydrogenase
MMYHSWDSQNAWLRQIVADNALYVNTRTAAGLGLDDGDWVWIESPHGKLRCRIRTMEGVEPGTVWTWNAIGKQGGAWGLAPDAPEATTGFLLNHLISEHLPRRGDDGRRITNSDPVTGQAAWFDVRVRLTKCAPGEYGTAPRAPSLPTSSAVPRPRVLRWRGGRDEVPR